MEVRLWRGEQEIVVGLRRDGDVTVADVAGAEHEVRIAPAGPRTVADSSSPNGARA